VPSAVPLSDELVQTLDDAPAPAVLALSVDDAPSTVLALVGGMQGPAGPPGPPGPPGPGYDPTAIPRLLPYAITPGSALPAAEPLSYVWSTVAKTIVVFDAGRWVALAGGGTTEPEPPGETTIVNDAGEPLVNDLGETLTYGPP
jgi:hypothetical protein